MAEEKEKFYAHYRMFDSLQEMMDYSVVFPEMPCDIEYFKLFLADRLRELEANKEMNPNFTNETAFKLLAFQIPLTCKLPETTKHEIVFFPTKNPEEWAIKITPNGIVFNREFYKESSADDFARVFMDILESVIGIKFPDEYPKSIKFKEVENRHFNEH